jgi:membrane protein YdbS with pleckstrin-like domain
MLVRPSVKLIKLAYFSALVLAVAVILLSLNYNQPAIYWLLLIPLVITIVAATKHAVRRTTTLVIEDGRVRHESGILSKSSRVMDLTKVQDVRMDQTLAQRMLGIGNVSLETAGETSRITIVGVDDPRQVSDHILQMARAAQPH